MRILKTSTLSAVVILATGGIFAGGCSQPTPPPPGDLAQRNIAGQAAAYQDKMAHTQRGGQGQGQNPGMAAGQAAAMQARMAAQGQHP